MQEIIDRILAIIDQEKIEQKEFEEKAGLSNGVVSKWKKGISKPSATAIMKISKAYGIPTDYIYFGKRENKFSITNNNNTITGGIQANTYHSESNEPKDKIQEELLKILSELTVEEQIKLMNLVYNFRENLNEKKQR